MPTGVFFKRVCHLPRLQCRPPQTPAGRFRATPPGSPHGTCRVTCCALSPGLSGGMLVGNINSHFRPRGRLPLADHRHSENLGLKIELEVCSSSRFEDTYHSRECSTLLRGVKKKNQLEGGRERFLKPYLPEMRLHLNILFFWF